MIRSRRTHRCGGRPSKTGTSLGVFKLGPKPGVFRFQRFNFSFEGTDVPLQKPCLVGRIDHLLAVVVVRRRSWLRDGVLHHATRWYGLP